MRVGDTKTMSFVGLLFGLTADVEMGCLLLFLDDASVVFADFNASEEGKKWEGRDFSIVVVEKADAILMMDSIIM